jgi:hypothetical protein
MAAAAARRQARLPPEVNRCELHTVILAAEALQGLLHLCLAAFDAAAAAAGHG